MSDGEVPFFMVSLSLFHCSCTSGAGYQKLSKEDILLERVVGQSNFCILEYTVHQFFLESAIVWSEKI